MKSILKFLIKCYQYTLSPMMGHSCRFTPSCSHYALEAIERHGALKGSYLTIKRLLRCQPFAKAGYDPVPHQPHELPPQPHSKKGIC